VWNRGTVTPPTYDDIDLEALKNAKYLHLDGHQMECAIYASQKAKEFGVKVSLDAGSPYPGIDRLLPLVDVLIPSEEFSLKYTGCATAEEAAAQLYEKYHPEVLIITQGSKGGFIWEDGKAVRYPVFPVNAVDSNGAGDTFHGAFVAARVKGMTIAEAAAFASATSALKCTRVGAQEGIPGFEEVVAFMKENKGVIVNG
jgi:sulfofructose kinase